MLGSRRVSNPGLEPGIWLNINLSDIPIPMMQQKGIKGVRVDDSGLKLTGMQADDLIAQYIGSGWDISRQFWIINQVRPSGPGHALDPQGNAALLAERGIKYMEAGNEVFGPWWPIPPQTPAQFRDFASLVREGCGPDVTLIAGFVNEPERVQGTCCDVIGVHPYGTSAWELVDFVAQTESAYGMPALITEVSTLTLTPAAAAEYFMAMRSECERAGIAGVYYPAASSDLDDHRILFTLSGGVWEASAAYNLITDV